MLRRLLLLLMALGLAASVRAEDQRDVTVGMPGRIDQLVLSGPELEAKPNVDRKLPIVLRVAASYPHGTAFRYDLIYYGLEPGEFDLKEFLRRKDGSSMADLPAIGVKVRTMLPPGQILPNGLRTEIVPGLGGYRTSLIVAGVAWCAGLAAIVLVGRRKKAARLAVAAPPVTLADRLQPLVERAMAGTLSALDRAELERTLLAFWRERLALAEAKPASAFAQLREHPEAGRLVRFLEDWLHRPEPAPNVDVNELLAPYRASGTLASSATKSAM